MMGDVVEQAKQALEGVTPEPWDVRDGFVYPLAIRCGLGGIRPQDAEFISAARTLVPELVAEVERLRDQVRRIRECAFDDDVVAVLKWDDGEVIPACISDIQNIASEAGQ